MTNRTKITMSGARAFAPADGREAVMWDSAAPGLGLRARSNGRKTWIVHRRCNGSVVKRTLGALDALTVEDARHAARALISDAETGGAAAAVPAVQTFAPAFLADCAERWKPATRESYAHTVRRWILPAFGNRPVDVIGAKDVRNWHDDIAAMYPGSAHWALAAMSSMMKHAEALGLRREDSNPCKGLRRRKTGFEAHYLTDDEFAALGRALDDAEAECPVAVAALRFLLYTGARKSEALRLKWEHVHGDRAVLPDSKTGPRTIWLASPARAVLAARSRQTNCPWVFASPCGGPASVDKAWIAIRAAAGLPTLRLHDLRHSLAAVAVNGGEGLRVVAGLLGHADIKTTFGYAHLAEGSVFEAANRVSRGLADMLSLAVEKRIEDGEGGGLAGLADAMQRIAGVIEAESRRAPGALSWIGLMFGPGDGRRSGTRQLILVEIALDFDELRPARQAIGAIRAIAAEIPADIGQGVTIRLTGSPALKHEELQAVRTGMGLAGALSLTLVVLLLLICFRSIRLPLAVLATLIVGLVWTAAFAAATVRVLNLISVAFAVLFIGLCVDFGIHYGLRYCEAARRGLERETASALAAASVGPGLGLAALAAGIGFLSFLPTDYLGLAELGFIASAGMAIGFFATLTLLPAFMAVLRARADGAGGGGRFAETLARLLEGRARGVVVAAGIVFVATAALSPWVRFDFDPLRLKDPESESVRTVIELVESGDGDAYALVHLAASIEAADAAAARIERLAEVDSARTFSDFVPKDQDDKLAIVEEVGGLVEPAFVADRAPPPSRAETIAALGGLGGKLEALAKAGGDSEALAARRLAGALAGLIAAEPGPARLADLTDRLLRNLPAAVDRLRDALSAEAVDAASVPAALRDRWIAEDGRAKVEIHAAAPIHRDREALRRFVESVRNAAPRATGPPVTVLEAGDAVVAAFLRATAIAVVAIALLLAVTLRSLRSVVIGFLPLALAALVTIAAMVGLGLSFNHANVIVLPLLFGLGVANGIHLLARERREGAAAPAIRSSTPRAVLFSALTTLASFASLGISSHPGTASMGVLLTIALVSLLACSLTVLPGLMLTWPINRS